MNLLETKLSNLRGNEVYENIWIGSSVLVRGCVVVYSNNVSEVAKCYIISQCDNKIK